MPDPMGRTVPLTLPRRLIGDFLHFARQVPTIPVQRHINVRALVEARRQAVPKISWCLLFMKGYARLAAEEPVFRRAYLPYPYPRLYEHSLSRAAMAVERDYEGEKAVFFAYFRSPDTQPLAALEASLHYYLNEPIEKVPIFRRALAVCRLPLPIRRAYWWAGINLMGSKKANRMGTFGMTVYSGLGAESLHPLSTLTTTLNYGVIDAEGNVPVRIVYDHRVMDGAVVARGLARLETILNTEILAELRQLREARAA